MTPAGTSNELDVQNGWEENTHTHTRREHKKPYIYSERKVFELPKGSIVVSRNARTNPNGCDPLEDRYVVEM